MLDITKSSEPNTDGGAEAAFASLQDTSHSLVIVARESASRYADLKEMFDLDVILDRRMAERRQRQISVQVERRQGDRRGRDITTDLRTRGWAAVGR